MKRSQVIYLIANWAKPEILHDIYSSNYTEWAENLLYTLENEIGMLPPSTPTLTINGTIIREINKWEDENEQT